MPYKDMEKRREAVRRHYRKNKSKFLERNRDKKLKIKNFLREKKDSPCSDCGETYPYFVMDFDHREPTKKLYEMAGIHRLQSWKRVKAEVAKCDVVCSNCHRLRTHETKKRLGEWGMSRN